MNYQQPIASFRGNWLLVGGVWAIGLYFLYLTWRYLGLTWLGSMVGLLALAMIALGVHLPLASVSVLADGVRYDRITGHSEMRWDEVETFYYQATRFRAYLVPVMTIYSFRLEDRSGNKMKFGEGLWNGKQLAEIMIRQTTPVISKRLTQRLEMGEKLTLGSIEISRSDGIRAKAAFGKAVQTPWNMFAGTRLHGGMVSILRRDKVNGGTAGVATTPNVFALNHMLAMIARNGVPLSAQAQAQAAKIDVG